ncbi:Protein disulfide isomerase-like 1-1 [Euphorbia peplus]|nr:Protein disulfide isomerase-like 1-1 [Euphorbia peplus]
MYTRIPNFFNLLRAAPSPTLQTQIPSHSFHPLRRQRWRRRFPPSPNTGTFRVLSFIFFFHYSVGESEKELVLMLDQSNFTETISKHDFIVVEFYAPWVGQVQSNIVRNIGGGTRARSTSVHNQPLHIGETDNDLDDMGSNTHSPTDEENAHDDLVQPFGQGGINEICKQTCK